MFQAVTAVHKIELTIAKAAHELSISISLVPGPHAFHLTEEFLIKRQRIRPPAYVDPVTDEVSPYEIRVREAASN